MPAELEALSLDELRRRRDEVREREEALSYRRRVLHAQLDLVDAAGSIADRDEFETLLAAILSGDAGRGRGAGEVRAVHVEQPPTDDDLAALPTDLVGMAQQDRDALAEQLRAEEQRVSDERRALLEELDELQDEIVRRFRRDGVDARQLLGETD